MEIAVGEADTLGLVDGVAVAVGDRAEAISLSPPRVKKAPSPAPTPTNRRATSTSGHRRRRVGAGGGSGIGMPPGGAGKSGSPFTTLSVSSPEMREEVRLSSFSHGAGCACKLGPRDLAHVLGLLGPSVKPEEVLVSEETGDDAAVFALPGGQALIATIDFFTPIVDDARDWGRIAAANALSDVYAMGGVPRIALNVAAWPNEQLPLELLSEVLAGGREVADRAGVVVVGGHTITSTEPLYGMTVLGFAAQDSIVRNATAAPGQSLVLTKPIGTGMIATAIKRQVATEEQAAAAVETMTELNDRASEAMVQAGAAAATDVTGFGLLGHLRRMLEASGCSAVVDASAVPLLAGALDLAREGVVAGGTKRNLAWLDEVVDWGACEEPERLLLADAQTSGGLLIATSEASALAFALSARGVGARTIGVTQPGEPGKIAVTGRLEG